ncbi:MAG TPA: MarR family transcriptional regulator [Methylomirabilota bacterium]|nr:MarR family transcriptional regulator [Methylomirabilota bacterium]
MVSRLRAEQYRALAEFRYRMRSFLRGSDADARQAGLEPQQYQLLLAIRGLTPGEEATIQKLADRLLLRHHSAVELIDRLEKRSYVERARSQEDRRRVLVSLLPRGERALERVARKRLQELRATGAALVAALSALLETKRKSISAAQRARRRKRGYQAP